MSDPRPSRFRKRQLETPKATTFDSAAEIDVVGCATIGFSSEHPAHLVEHLFDGSSVVTPE
jgi:hypothetical protein